MVLRRPVKPDIITDFVKPYVLKMHFTNKFLHAQVVHTPTATTPCSASTLEKELRENLRASQESTRDVAAAAKLGKILGERLLQRNIPGVKVLLKGEQRYHGKIKALVDSVREAGVKLL